MCARGVVCGVWPVRDCVRGAGCHAFAAPRYAWPFLATIQVVYLRLVLGNFAAAAGGVPVVLAGDLNITPTNSVYELLCRGPPVPLQSELLGE